MGGSASFPWGTLSVNVLGSLALGFLMVWLPERLASEEVRLFATVGLLGSFTTFSTFSYETVELIRAGAWGKAIGYTGGSVLLGIVAVLLGAAAALALGPSGR